MKRDTVLEAKEESVRRSWLLSWYQRRGLVEERIKNRNQAIVDSQHMI